MTERKLTNLQSYRKLIQGQFSHEGVELTKDNCIELVNVMSGIVDEYNRIANALKVLAGEATSLYSEIEDGENNEKSE